MNIGGNVNLAERGLGTFNISGSGAMTVSGTLAMVGYINSTQPGAGTLNLLSGGTLAANAISFNYPGQSSYGTANLNFNGGLLRATASNASFVNLAIGGSGSAAANVMQNGADIDTQAFNVTIGQALLHGGTNSTDGGLTKYGSGTLTLRPARPIPAPRSWRPGPSSCPASACPAPRSATPFPPAGRRLSTRAPPAPLTTATSKAAPPRSPWAPAPAATTR